MAPALIDAPARLHLVTRSLSDFQDHFLSAEETDELIHELPINTAMHGALLIHVGGVLKAFVREANLGRVLGGEVGIYTSFNPTRARAADVAFISHERLPELPAKGFLHVMPELLVEIISEANTWSDTFEKIYEYFEGGAKAVWIVDPVLREVRAFTSPKDHLVYRAVMNDVLDGGEVLPGFTVPVTDLLSV